MFLINVLGVFNSYFAFILLSCAFLCLFLSGLLDFFYYIVL